MKEMNEKMPYEKASMQVVEIEGQVLLSESLETGSGTTGGTSGEVEG